MQALAAMYKFKSSSNYKVVYKDDLSKKISDIIDHGWDWLGLIPSVRYTEQIVAMATLFMNKSSSTTGDGKYNSGIVIFVIEFWKTM